MPGLLRGMARTAVVAGTATAVSNRVSRRQSQRWSEQDQAAYEEQPVAAPPPSAPAPGDEMDAKLAQLKALGELRAQGVLTDAEFEAQKGRLLAD
jgi:hypothetical protein